MFLFSCCKQAETNKGYQIRTTDNNKNQTVKFVPNLNSIRKSVIEDNRIIVHKIEKSPYSQLLKDYSNTKKQWTDLEFPPDSTSLGAIKSVDSSQWKRIS